MCVSIAHSCLMATACQSDKENQELKEIETTLSTTEYTYDTLVSDLIHYCGYRENETSPILILYPYTYVDEEMLIEYQKDWNNEEAAISRNKSIEKLIDATLIKKMKSAEIEWRGIYKLAKLFPDSWEDHRTLVVSDDNDCYLPLFYLFLSNEEENVSEKIASAIKPFLRDPASFYMEDKWWSVYTRQYNGDQSLFIKQGRYTDNLYLEVTYYAKNGFGGVNKSTTWIEYTEYGSFNVSRYSWNSQELKYIGLCS